MKQGVIKVPEVPFGTYKLQAICLNIGFSQLHKNPILPWRNEAGVAAQKWQSEFSKQLSSAWTWEQGGFWWRNEVDFMC